MRLTLQLARIGQWRAQFAVEAPAHALHFSGQPVDETQVADGQCHAELAALLSDPAGACGQTTVFAEVDLGVEHRRRGVENQLAVEGQGFAGTGAGVEQAIGDGELHGSAHGAGGIDGQCAAARQFALHLPVAGRHEGHQFAQRQGIDVDIESRRSARIIDADADAGCRDREAGR